MMEGVVQGFTPDWSLVLKALIIGIVVCIAFMAYDRRNHDLFKPWFLFLNIVVVFSFGGFVSALLSPASNATLSVSDLRADTTVENVDGCNVHDPVTATWTTGSGDTQKSYAGTMYTFKEGLWYCSIHVNGTETSSSLPIEKLNLGTETLTEIPLDSSTDSESDSESK